MEHVRQRVNVLVFVLIVLMLGGLAVAGVVEQRINDKGVKCMRNMRFLGIAVSNYYDQYGHFPMATEPAKHLPVEQRFSWMMSMIPFLEANREWAHCDLSKPWDAEKHKKLVNDTIPYFKCPEDSSPVVRPRPGRTTYVGIAGIGKDAPFLPRNSPLAGIFVHERQT